MSAIQYNSLICKGYNSTLGFPQDLFMFLKRLQQNHFK